MKSTCFLKVAESRPLFDPRFETFMDGCNSLNIQRCPSKKTLYNPLTRQGLRREHQEIVDKLRMLVACRVLGPSIQRFD